MQRESRREASPRVFAQDHLYISSLSEAVAPISISDSAGPLKIKAAENRGRIGILPSFGISEIDYLQHDYAESVLSHTVSYDINSECSHSFYLDEV